jgi:hypothetical protein
MAGYTTAAKNSALTAVAALGNYISLHTADPSTTGANEVTGGTYARVATTWGGSSGSADAGSQVTINVPAGVTIAFWGIWSAITGGTWVVGEALPANETYGSAGTYLLTPTLSATG